MNCAPHPFHHNTHDLTRIYVCFSTHPSHHKHTGTLPSSMNNLVALQNLYLSNCNFTVGPGVPKELLARCVSPTSPLRCTGLPPDSCSAFPHAAMTVDQKCTQCPNTGGETALWMLCEVAAMLLFFFVYYKLITHYPDKLKSWFSGFSMIASHMQLITIIIGLNLPWPPGFTIVAKTASVAWVALGSVGARPECAFVDIGSGGSAIVTAFALNLAVIFCLVAQALTRCCGRCCCDRDKRDRLSDKAELAATIVFSFQLSKSVGFISGSFYVNNNGGYVYLFRVPAAFFLLLVDVLILTRFWLGIRKLRYPDKKICCARSSTCCFALGLPRERQETRLRYLTKRFDDHAPRWQFVKWLFQASLILTTLIPDKYVVATIAAVLTSVALAAHWKVQPYALPILNKLQSFMYACILATLLLVIPYSKAIDGYRAGNHTGGGANHSWCGEALDVGVCVYGWVILAVLVSSVIGITVVLILKWVAHRNMRRFESHSAFNAQIESQGSGVDSGDYHLMDDDGGAETAVDSKGGERGNCELAVFLDSSDRDLLAMGESAGTTKDGGGGK